MGSRDTPLGCHILCNVLSWGMEGHTRGPYSRTDWEGLGGSNHHPSSLPLLTHSAGRREVCRQVASDLSFTRTTEPGREEKQTGPQSLRFCGGGQDCIGSSRAGSEV